MKELFTEIAVRTESFISFFSLARMYRLLATREEAAAIAEAFMLAALHHIEWDHSKQLCSIADRSIRKIIGI